MKRFFVIECDSEFHAVFVHDVTRELTSNPDTNRGVAYYRSATADVAICECPGPEFYGHLDLLLVNRTKLENAAPIEPIIETPVTDEPASSGNRD